jgi:CRP-like cAMP-binding protein
MRPGEFFGEVAVLDGSPRSATVVAATPLVAIRLFRRTLLRFLEAEPQLAIKILDGIVRRLRALTSPLDA